MKERIEALAVLDATDVMELVAHITEGPEPDEETARRWLENHMDPLTEAMTYAAQDYIREHWRED